jgi:hypothetical protein
MPANAPEMITAAYLCRYTFTPRDSAATGFSPQDRSRRPNRVFQSTQKLTGTRMIASIVSGATSVTSPRRMPATSEMPTRCSFSRSPSQSERNVAE